MLEVRTCSSGSGASSTVRASRLPIIVGAVSYAKLNICGGRCGTRFGSVDVDDVQDGDCRSGGGIVAV